jgi:hypothetical protein
MTIFYRGPEVTISDQVFKVWTHEVHTFRIEDLEHVYVAVTRPWWPPMSGRTYELWARWSGAEICLFSTADTRTFGHVRRALVRALDLHRNRQDGAGRASSTVYRSRVRERSLMGPSDLRDD